MILQKRYKHFNRYREVAHTLAKHGFGFLLRQLGLSEFIKHKIHKKSEREGEELSTGKRIRLVVEELGTTFIKIGQILSTRTDLIPAEWAGELAQLQDQVPPFSFIQVREQIEGELGRSLEDLFLYIDPKPLAAASIGQVHRATLKNGEDVVVKVQRPKVEEEIKTDMEILYDLARLLEKHTDWASLYSLKETALELESILTDELNYLMEGQNLDVFRRNFQSDKRVYIPQVYWDYTTKKVLTLEYVKAIKLTDTEKLEKVGVDVGQVVVVLAEAVFQQILLDGVFHGDPHPGNIMVFPDGRIIFLDFGITGVIDDELKKVFGNLIIAQVSRNTEAILRTFLSLGLAPPDIDRRGLRQDIERLQHRYYDMPLSKIKMGEAMNEFLHLAFEYQIRLPSEFTLLSKAMLILEGLISRLAPEKSLMEIIEPFAKDLLQRRFSYEYGKKWLFKQVQDYGEIFAALPRQISDLLNVLEGGQFKILLEHRDLEQLSCHLNHMINRLAFSIVLASLIVGLSLIVQQSEHSLIWRIPLAEVGFLVAGAMGFWLLISIIRSGRF